MDAGSVMGIILVVGLCFLPIIIFIIQKDSFIDTTHYYDSDDTTSNFIRENPVLESPLPDQIQMKITIYSLTSMSPKIICPYCDGENVIGTKECSICRRTM